MPGDPAELRQKLVEFGLTRTQAPLDVLEAVRELVVRLDEWGVPLVSPAPAPVAAAPEARTPAPRVALAVDQVGNVVARTPEAQPVARTLKTILDLIAKKPLGSMAQVALEFAAHIEALELENEDLRREVGR